MRSAMLFPDFKSLRLVLRDEVQRISKIWLIAAFSDFNESVIIHPANV